MAIYINNSNVNSGGYGIISFSNNPQGQADIHYDALYAGAANVGFTGLSQQSFGVHSIEYINKANGNDMATSRTSDYQANGDLLAETLNDDLDKIVLMTQQVEDQVNNNTLKVDQFDTSVDLTLPLVAARKGTVLGFHATTGAPEAGPTIANVNSLSAIT